MFARRPQAGILVVVIVSLATALPEAAASPARRLARRGVLLAPPPGTAIVPPAGPLRPNPLLAVPIAPGGPAVVIGPAGRVRRRLLMPGAVEPVPVATVTESVAAAVAQPPVAKATPPASPAPPQTAAALRSAAVSPKQPAPTPQPPAVLAVEQIPAPLPAGGAPATPAGRSAIRIRPSRSRFHYQKPGRRHHPGPLPALQGPRIHSAGRRPPQRDARGSRRLPTGIWRPRPLGPAGGDVRRDGRCRRPLGAAVPARGGVRPSTTWQTAHHPAPGVGSETRRSWYAPAPVM